MTETASPETAHANSDPADSQLDNQTAPEISDNDHKTEAKVEQPLPEVILDEPKTNGPVEDTEAMDEHPAKRRRVHEDSPSAAQRKKPVSPPWKRSAAEGPTSFTENGRRKSGRVNTIPLELQPPSDKRMTRRAHHGLRGSPPTNSKYTATNGHTSSAKSSSTMTNGTHKAGSLKTTSKTTPKVQTRKSVTHESKPAHRSTRKRTPSPPNHPTRQSTRSRRVLRQSLDGDATTPAQDSKYATQDSPNRTPRIKLRLRPSTIPLVHPGQISKRAKLGPTFEEYWEGAGNILVDDGGILAPEDGPRYTDHMAQRDAHMISRIEQAVAPGGILSAERCSAFVPEAEEEPPRQWAHMDHMVKAVANFRKLMLIEQQKHRNQAKRIAEACRDAWLRRQPKTAEQVEAEARAIWIGRYRVVIKSVFGTWENVRAEINRRKVQEWEAEEQRRVKAALNEAVNLSEQRLQAQRTQLDSDALSDEDDILDDDSDDAESLRDADNTSDTGPHSDMDADDDDSGEDDEAMSSSDEDDNVGDSAIDLADEHLTQEQLRAKYANLPNLETGDDNEAGLPNGASNGATAKAGPASGSDLETSDESVDMDDDLGTTDMDSDEEESGSEDVDDESEEDEEPSGLLGLFFGKSELKQMKKETVPEVSEDDEDAKMLDAGIARESTLTPFPQNGEPDDEDEVSLIQHPGFDLANDDESGPAPDIISPNTESPIQAFETAQLATTVNGRGPPSADQPGHGKSDLFGQTFVEMETRTPAKIVVDDVAMPDAPMEAHGIPEVEITTPPGETKVLSPETDPVTVPPTPERSHSPPTSDTKPSEADTLSLATPGAKDAISRSASPNPSNVATTKIPFLLRGTLREYQHYGLDWLAGLYANNTNGILADEMGLGKTIQTIALLAHLASHHEVWGPHLVIVPTSVMLNWEMEFKKWCPGFKILSYYGTQEERKKKRLGWTDDDTWNVCITSYQLVLQDAQVFRRRRWQYMILDEAHNIKNFKSQRWQTLLGFNTRSRLLLTGTPLQNNLTELWSLLFFLMPPQNGVGGFADLQEFHDWFHKPESQILESGRETMDEEARAIISKLHKVLRPYLLRRLKADVEKQMPAKYEHVEFCRLSKRQRELYDGFLARTDTRETLASGNYLSIINCLMQLRKVCNHPDLFVDRPIMTSFKMHKSIAADYEATEQFTRRTLLAKSPMSVVSLRFLNIIPTAHEYMSNTAAERISQLSSHRVLLDLREAQKARAQNAYTNLDPATVKSNIEYLESAARWGRFEELQHCVYLNALRRQQRPIYGKRLVEFLTLGVNNRPHKPRPKIPHKIISWFEEDSGFLSAAIPTIDQRAASMQTTVQKFACVTPAVITRDMTPFVLGRRGIQAFEEADLRLSAPVRWAPFMPKETPPDPWHEARMRLSIQFPDRRLLQYDCGKLQVLDKLLRKLQSGGHRALIFTQMTKVLDILEQFLNIHGHKYLRLDGSTKVEQRQILTDRFNNDPRILCFILSTRSGGLGINLTGADTVIFYDQDWNPAMDKQCQDRCHRIGQTRDVHIYRLISEHTIEANILRKASQKQMLDDVVIQEGEFTTDYFNKLSVRDVIGEEVDLVDDGMAAANAAMDRVLGGGDGNEPKNVGKVLEQAEDKEDVAAARVAEREVEADDADFQEKPSGHTSGASSTRQGTPRDEKPEQPRLGPSGLSCFSESVAPDDMLVADEIEVNAWGGHIRNVDDYMLRLMVELLKDIKPELPKDKKKSKKKGKDTRKR